MRIMPSIKFFLFSLEIKQGIRFITFYFFNRKKYNKKAKCNVKILVDFVSAIDLMSANIKRCIRYIKVILLGILVIVVSLMKKSTVGYCIQGVT